MIRQILKALTDRSGASAVEFAFIAPALCMLCLGIAKFGITLNNYVILTDAVGTGARQLAVSRGGSAPYTSTTSAVTNAATGLVTSNIRITVSVNGTACSMDSTCSTLLASAAGQSATVTATYGCDLLIFGFDYLPNCTLSSTMSDRIE